MGLWVTQPQSPKIERTRSDHYSNVVLVRQLVVAGQTDSFACALHV